MKKIIAGIVFCTTFFLLLTPFTLDAYVSVKGYYKSNGTYVAPHVRSNPNGLKYDNYSYTPSQGLYNPSYGTRGANWDTPTYITDSDYYVGKTLYESNSTGVSGYTYPLSNTKNSPVIAPANTTIYGSDWYCNTGYKTVFDNNLNKTSCELVVAPSNAKVIGSDWYCDTGYRTIFNNSLQKTGCEQVFAPLNAKVVGSDWYCDAGYKTIFDNSFRKTSCEKVIAPANATIYGSDWYCNTGYKTIYDNYYTKVGCQ